MYLNQLDNYQNNWPWLSWQLLLQIPTVPCETNFVNFVKSTVVQSTWITLLLKKTQIVLYIFAKLDYQPGRASACLRPQNLRDPKSPSIIFCVIWFGLFDYLQFNLRLWTTKAHFQPWVVFSSISCLVGLGALCQVVRRGLQINFGLGPPEQVNPTMMIARSK